MTRQGKLELRTWVASLIDGGSLPRLSRTVRALQEDRGVRDIGETADRIGEQTAYVQRVASAAFTYFFRPVRRAEPPCDEEQIDLRVCRQEFAEALRRRATQATLPAGLTTFLRYRAFLLDLDENPKLKHQLPPPHPALSAHWQRRPYSKEARYDVMACWLAAQPVLEFAVTDDNVKQLWSRMKRYVAADRELAARERSCVEAEQAWQACRARGQQPTYDPNELQSLGTATLARRRAP